MCTYVHVYVYTYILHMYVRTYVCLACVQMYRRIYKGIPDSVRGEVWRRFLHIDTIKRAHVYDQMKRVARDASPSLKQIDKDVLRTFRNHIMYWDRYGIK